MASGCTLRRVSPSAIPGHRVLHAHRDVRRPIDDHGEAQRIGASEEAFQESKEKMRLMSMLVSVKKLGVVVLAAMTLVFTAPVLSLARGAEFGQGFTGGMGGHSGAMAGHPGFGGNPAFAGHPRFEGPPGFAGHPGFQRDGHGRGFVFVGPGLFYWWPSYPYVGAPPGYRYYCSSAGTYYPYVENCPEPWVEVPAG
jgi:hypothetical protein